MTNKEYWLIKEITTTGHKNPIQVIDKFVAKSIKEAEKEFKRRDNFSRILEKANLILCEAKRWYS